MSEVIWEFVEPGIDLSMIETIEKEFGVIFPKDYVECVLKNHGGQPVPDTFDVGKRKGTVFGGLLLFTKESPDFIADIYEWIKDTLPVGVIPFAADPGGNFICFDYHKNPESPTIVFWNHEYAYPKENYEEMQITDQTYDEFLRQEAIRPICNTFTELLGMLYEDNE